MEPQEEQQPPLIDQLKEYAELRIKLAKYKAIDGGSSVMASIIADVVAIISMLLAFIFASFTLAFYLAWVFDSFWKGFGCVGLIYLLIAIIIKINKARFEKPVANAIIQKFFKN
jgi:hypothetical protein